MGPDFSKVDCWRKAEDLHRQGILEPLLLLPEQFGGEAVPGNVVYVPVGLAAVRAGIDDNIVAPLMQEGKVRYRVTPEYQGISCVPIALRIDVSGPGEFSTELAVWGKALERSVGENMAGPPA